MDINFDLNDIRVKASNYEVYKRGKDYYQKKKIKRVSQKEVQNGTYISVLVRGNLDTYHVHVVINKQGYFNNYSCTCKAFRDFPGLCKHIVATLIDIYDIRNLDYRIASESKNIISDNIIDNVANKMLSIFEKDAYKEINEKSLYLESSGDVRVVPKLIIDHNQQFKLIMSVGLKKFYIIKNLNEFVENIECMRNFSYGKDLEFVHEITAFVQQDIPLIEFVIREILNLKTMINTVDPYGYYISRNISSKALCLSSVTLDEFINVMIDREIYIEISNIKDKVLIKEETPPMKFELKKTRRGAFIRANFDKKVITFSGKKKMYVYVNGFLYRCSEDFKKLIMPILSSLGETKDNILELKGNNLCKFLTYVLPKMEQYGLITVDNEIYKNYEIIPLETKLYFDQEDNKITVDVKFCYNEDEFNALSKNVPVSIFRDSISEYKMLKRLDVIGFKPYLATKQYILSDDDKIFNFIQTQLDELRRYAEVFVTDAFKNIAIKYPQPMKLGIRIKGAMLELTFDTSDFDTKELLQMIESHKLRKKYHRLKDGSFISTDSEEIQVAQQLLDGLDISQKDLKKGLILLPKYRAMYLDNLVRQNESITAKRDLAFKQMTREIRDFSDMDIEIPKSLDEILRGYQKTGYRWMKTLSAYNLCGILADDMGLGKTLQVIAMFLQEKEEEAKPKPSIVVAPTSLVYNWQNEINKFAPQLSTLVVVGAATKRDELIKMADSYNVILTSYDTLKRDIEKYDVVLFKYAIADEAQNIKNANTQNAKAVKLLNAQNRFALTGTPIENSLSELWSIFDFLMPGYLYSSSKFQKLFEIPIVKNNDESKISELRRHIAPFILRRLKKDVLKELPDKIETTILAEMTAEQKKLYTAYLLKARGEMEREITENGFSKSQIKILALLTRLRQICCHPALFTEGFEAASGKFELLYELISDCIASGHRILVFSQFTSMLKLIIDILIKNNLQFFYLDGSTPAKERISLVDRFNAGEKNLFLISLKAGGTGLNLTGADVVIHYDPWWNPAVQNQATDRAYRIGQKNKVQVFNLVTKDSIEEKIVNLQMQKKDLTDSVIKEGTNFISKMSPEEIRNLFEDK